MYTMSVQKNPRPNHNEKKIAAMKAEHAVKRITFNPAEANPGETLYVFSAQAYRKRSHRARLAGAPL